MPPRLSKRQQREQEELQALAGPSNVEGNDDASEEEPDSRDRQGASSRIISFAAVGLINSNHDQQTSHFGAAHRR